MLDVGLLDGIPCGAVLREGTDEGKSLGADEIDGLSVGFPLGTVVGSDEGVSEGSEDGDNVGLVLNEGNDVGSLLGLLETDGEALGDP